VLFECFCFFVATHNKQLEKQRANLKDDDNDDNNNNNNNGKIRNIFIIL